MNQPETTMEMRPAQPTCPLRGGPCEGERCAWWVERRGRCALTVLAGEAVRTQPGGLRHKGT